MTRISNKQIIPKQIDSFRSAHAEFDKNEIESFVKDRGYQVIYERAHLCPCKSKESNHRNICKNCGGTSWFFVNPKETRMLITSIMSDGKISSSTYIDWGLIDSGSAMVTALNSDKLSFMDRITIKTATAEHNQILYPKMSNDDTRLFAFTKYNIKSIDFIGLFIDAEEPIKKLELGTDYTFHDNVVIFDAQYHSTVDPCVSIRYIHNPVLHVVDVFRESFTSTKGASNQTQTQLILPIRALAKKAHLIKDMENLVGDEYIDNSWLPDACEQEDVSGFVRQLRYTEVQDIYDSLTDNQKLELELMLSENSDNALGLNGGGILQIDP